MTISLTPDQERALEEIVSAYKKGGRHLLTGYAGTGKTTLLIHVVHAFLNKRLKLAVAAPTHKAVAVIGRKLREARLEQINCRTLHSLLGLRARYDEDKLEFYRPAKAPPIIENVVIIDECSMIDSEMCEHIKLHMQRQFILFVGDPAQLPPIGEKESLTFSVESRSHLGTIVRQAEDNPVVHAATSIRKMQGGRTRWDWLREMRSDGCGVFIPAVEAKRWMHKAFTSPDFEADPDRFRYLAWTNPTVKKVNNEIRQWRYGDRLRPELPFMPGEMVLLREPVFVGGEMVFRTNDETRALDVVEDVASFEFMQRGRWEAWKAECPSWKVTLDVFGSGKVDVYIARKPRVFQQIIRRIKQEASSVKDRWQDYHRVMHTFPKMQSIYALTVHNSQGSTFRNTFVDIRDIRRRQRSNMLEFQQLLYVAWTRPSHCLVVIGHP